MFDRLSPEALFLEHLGWIEKAAAIACRKHGLWGDDAEDFAAIVKMKLMEDDYAAFRKFRGECDLRTYLATVVTRRAYEYARERWGRWRSSRAAERLGSPALELEMLVHRDGYTLEQAGEKLRTSGVTRLSDTELARLLASLPDRPPLRPVEVGSAPLDASPGSGRADEAMEAEEKEARRGKMEDALGRAMARLDPEDRLIVRMHFADGRTLADVARTLRLEQKPLYRRIEKLRLRLRGYLEEEGVSPRDLRGLLDEEPG